MTESRAPYILTPADPFDSLYASRPALHTGPLEPVASRPALHAGTLEPFDSPTYLQPGPDDVRAVKALLGMSGSQIASLVGVDSRIVRRWLAVPPAAHTAIPYAPWRLMIMAAGLVPMSLDSGQK